ncbi:hypothetical protein [Microbacterium sulfonylureivorans]|uniref:hypothetical protein n=1 Tax=Microbacterium sulfonylureivorans TaxID=2486854 RepID=UPI000FD86AD4|nr:hypothetical protein [Microbacterium sulfonylureivorans]
MSNPTEPSPPQPEEPSAAQTDSDPASPDAQPTEVYPPAGLPPAADAQPTEVYPPAGLPPAADAQPTEVYPPAGQAGYPPQGYGRPVSDPGAYGQTGYAAPPYGNLAQATPPGAASVSGADRPRTLGWIALGAGIGGLALVAAAFIPLLWISIVLAVIGGVMLLAALVLGIITLASRKQGGKGLGIGAIAIAILGGLAWIAAMSLAVILSIAAVSTESVGGEPSPFPSSETTPDDESTEEGGEEASGTYDEAAFLAQIRPEITAIMQEIEPSITEEMLSQVYPDEVLVELGKGLVVTGDVGREAIITSLSAASGGVFTEEQATRFYDTVYDAAQQHLVE